MMNGYIPAARHDLAVRIAVDTLGAPRFKGSVMTWGDDELMICPEWPARPFTYIKAQEKRGPALDAYRAIFAACALLADQGG